MKNCTVLIPAYKPDHTMLPFLRELSQQNFERIILINDGSGPEYDEIFIQSQKIPSVDYYAHAINMGKRSSTQNRHQSLSHHRPRLFSWAHHS